MNSVLTLFKSDKFIAKLFAIVAAVYAIFIAVKYSNQLPLEVHSFRQSQTALTIFWFLQDGFKLAYETPVAGPPWSIPFEFPLYQALVAIASWLTGGSIETAARLTSFVFLLLCFLPVYSIVKNLKLPDSISPIFAALVLSSPVYLFWGRTVMIETTALFFSILAIKYFSDGMVSGWSRRTIALYLVSMVLAILQKATTGLPVVAVLALIYVIFEVRRDGLFRTLFSRRSIAKGLVLFIFPVAMGVVWTLYTDQVKSLNPFGSQLTSSALSPWNWGTWAQRFSLDLYDKVVWERVFKGNLAGLVGALVLAWALLARNYQSAKLPMLAAWALATLPIFLFTNLHIVHNYYQSANLIFLLFALAVALGAVIAPALGSGALAVALLVILGSNYAAYESTYSGAVMEKFNKTSSQTVEIAEIIQHEAQLGSSTVMFGNDWSSDIAYLSQRKSFAVPVWFKHYTEVARAPEKFVGSTALGAVLLCPTVKEPTLTSLLGWSQQGRAWKVGRVRGCHLAAPETPLPSGFQAPEVVCMGGMDEPAFTTDGGQQVIAFDGWLAPLPSKATKDGQPHAERVYLSLQAKPGAGGEVAAPLLLEMLRTNRPDANTHIKIPPEANLGFARTMLLSDSRLTAREYTASLVRSTADGLRTCKDQRKVMKMEKSIADVK